MSKELMVRIRKEPEFRDLPTPDYATSHSVGVDLYAAIDNQVMIPPGSWRLISTGVRVAIPDGYEGQVRPRSGLALKYGVTLLNSPGTIDSDYRGIVGVILINLGEESFLIKRGDRIAQMVVTPVARLRFTEVNYLKPTQRGNGGFGSTGMDRDDERTDQIDTTDRIGKGKH
jgi:dUTP pyrophosphatase